MPFLACALLSGGVWALYEPALQMFQEQAVVEGDSGGQLESSSRASSLANAALDTRGSSPTLARELIAAVARYPMLRKPTTFQCLKEAMKTLNYNPYLRNCGMLALKEQIPSDRRSSREELKRDLKSAYWTFLAAEGNSKLKRDIVVRETVAAILAQNDRENQAIIGCAFLQLYPVWKDPFTRLLETHHLVLGEDCSDPRMESAESKIATSDCDQNFDCWEARVMDKLSLRAESESRSPSQESDTSREEKADSREDDDRRLAAAPGPIVAVESQTTSFITSEWKDRPAPAIGAVNFGSGGLQWGSTRSGVQGPDHKVLVTLNNNDTLPKPGVHVIMSMLPSRAGVKINVSSECGSSSSDFTIPAKRNCQLLVSIPPKYSHYQLTLSANSKSNAQVYGQIILIDSGPLH